MSNSETNKSYMELMDDFFNATEAINDEFSNTQIVDILIQNRTIIDNIAILTKKTKLFANAHVQYEKFKTEMFEKRVGEEQIIFAYTQLLGKIAAAPTSFHMRGAIILIMPLLSDSLSQIWNSKLKK